MCGGVCFIKFKNDLYTAEVSINFGIIQFLFSAESFIKEIIYEYLDNTIFYFVPEKTAPALAGYKVILLPASNSNETYHFFDLKNNTKSKKIIPNHSPLSEQV